MDDLVVAVVVSQLNAGRIGWTENNVQFITFFEHVRNSESFGEIKHKLPVVRREYLECGSSLPPHLIGHTVDFTTRCCYDARGGSRPPLIQPWLRGRRRQIAPGL